MENRLAKLKDEVPGETPAHAKFRAAAVDEFNTWVGAVLREGGELGLRLDVDRKAADLSLSVSLTGKPDSDLTSHIRDLGQIKSIAASLVGKDSAINGLVHVSLPAKLRNALAPLIDEGEKKLLDKQEDQNKRALIEAGLKAFNPTLKSAVLDAGVDVRGPGAGGLYTLVLGARVKEGQAIDRTIRQVVKDLPAEQREAIKLDVDKADGVSIHRLTPDKTDEDFRKAFGDNPFFIAVREDALLVVAGDKGLETLKEVLAAGAKTGSVVQFEMAVARVAPLMTKEHKDAPEIARKAFANHKDADKVRLTLEGGKSLRLRLAMKAQLVSFFSMLDQAEKGGQ
jgi:hypothetical protein